MFLQEDMSQGSCVDLDPAFWFPEEAGKEARGYEIIAKGICNECPIQAKCLELALDSGEKWGIWGGLMPHERFALRRREKRKRP
jgi:WhiB family redox-sensing transcriptional regulator